MDTFQARPAIEISVKAQDRSYLMALHYCDVHRIPRRKPRAALSDFSGPQNVRFLNCEHLVDNLQDCLECWLDGVSLVDRCVPMENFLEHFSIGHKPLSRGDQAFQQNLGIGLVRMRGSDQIHWNIRVNEDHSR